VVVVALQCLLKLKVLGAVITRQRERASSFLQVHERSFTGAERLGIKTNFAARNKAAIGALSTVHIAWSISISRSIVSRPSSKSPDSTKLRAITDSALRDSNLHPYNQHGRTRSRRRKGPPTTN